MKRAGFLTFSFFSVITLITKSLWSPSPPRKRYPVTSDAGEWGAYFADKVARNPSIATDATTMACWFEEYADLRLKESALDIRVAQERIDNLLQIQNGCVSDEYSRGMYNGLVVGTSVINGGSASVDHLFI